MKRLVWLWLGLLIVFGVFALGQNPVPANDGVPAGLAPRAWACYPTGILPNFIIAKDLDQNGWDDLAVSCGASSDVWLYTNKAGAFTTPKTVSVPGGPVGLAAGYVSRGSFTGFPDIAVLSTANTKGNPSIVSWIRAARSQGALPLTGLPSNGLVQMAGADFNNDNRLDFAVAARDPASLFVFESPNYAAVEPLALPGAPVFISTGDFDQNGWNDIAVLCQGTGLGGSVASVVIFYNDGTGKFSADKTSKVALFAPMVPTGMDVGDFNADGYPDLVVVGNVANAGVSNGFAQVVLNALSITGAIGFVPQPAMATWGFNARFVEVADFDGNGRDDFAVANWGSDTVTIFLTDATALVMDRRPVDSQHCLCSEQMKHDLLSIQFKLFKIEVKCGHFPIGLAAGDFDHNGKIDLAVALQSANGMLCPQNPSCIEIDFDIACGFNPNQKPHQALGISGESTTCSSCKPGPCTGNAPPKPEIQTGSGTKK